MGVPDNKTQILIHRKHCQEQMQYWAFQVQLADYLLKLMEDHSILLGQKQELRAMVENYAKMVSPPDKDGKPIVDGFLPETPIEPVDTGAFGVFIYPRGLGPDDPPLTPTR